MSDRSVILALARVIVAAAWADGKLSQEEIDSLKDLLFRLPHAGPARGIQLPAQDWAALELYMQSPVDSAERARLLQDLQAELRTPADRQLAIGALDELVQADGVVTSEEQAVVQEIRAALEGVDLGLISQFVRMVRGPLQRRSDATSAMGRREAELEDFVKNRIYFEVRRRLATDVASASDEATLRKLSLAAGLMALVANVDGNISEDERLDISGAIAREWGLDAEAAAVVAEAATTAISSGMDYYRLTREFFTATSDDERVRFLDVLFGVARANGSVSSAEIAEIRRIAQSLNVARQQVNDALDRAR